MIGVLRYRSRKLHLKPRFRIFFVSCHPSAEEAEHALQPWVAIFLSSCRSPLGDVQRADSKEKPVDAYALSLRENHAFLVRNFVALTPARNGTRSKAKLRAERDIRVHASRLTHPVNDRTCIDLAHR